MRLLSGSTFRNPSRRAIKNSPAGTMSMPVPSPAYAARSRSAPIWARRGMPVSSKPGVPAVRGTLRSRRVPMRTCGNRFWKLMRSSLPLASWSGALLRCSSLVTSSTRAASPSTGARRRATTQRPAAPLPMASAMAATSAPKRIPLIHRSATNSSASSAAGRSPPSGSGSSTGSK